MSNLTFTLDEMGAAMKQLSEACSRRALLSYAEYLTMVEARAIDEIEAKPWWAPTEWWGRRVRRKYGLAR